MPSAGVRSRPEPALGKALPGRARPGGGKPCRPAASRSRGAVLGRDLGIMELVSARDFSRRSPQRIGRPGDLRIAQHLELLEHGRLDGQHAGQRITHAVQGGKPSAKVHQPAALGIDEAARGGELADGGEHSRVGAQAGGMDLGITAAEVQAVQVRGQARVGQRRERHPLDAGPRQRFQVVGIVEVEGLVAGDSQAEFGCGRRLGRAGTSVAVRIGDAGPPSRLVAGATRLAGHPTAAIPVLTVHRFLPFPRSPARPGVDRRRRPTGRGSRPKGWLARRSPTPNAGWASVGSDPRGNMPTSGARCRAGQRFR